ncbi:MFS general substrate transporter [Microthyrium microscopicum]|uniref:MFS general substrate transporter n=1 Tax=Microthyrium microscopicum TaxID=703497 RepID=A0A6A6U6D3_9PEZI|nr:MFS general substrate transporter [Microthyrium microscopicum]
MAEIHEKAALEHVDNVDRSSTTSPAREGDAQEAIIRHLETTGYEVGMTWRTIMAACAMGMCYNAYLFTLLIPPAILSFINAELGPDPTYTWITISWNLGGAIFVTVGGRLSDIFGRRWFFIAGSCIILIGSVVSATGKSIPQMIAGGALFGAGSGFLEMSFGAVQEIVPAEWRMVTIGLFDASSIIAQMMPLTSWAIIDLTGNWRNCYYMMIGFQALNIIFLFFFYNPPAFKTKHRADGKTKLQLLKEFDWIGLFLFVAGCTLLICGLSWGGSLHPWKSAATIAPIVVGFCTLIGLGFYERYGKITEPLLPPRLFKQVRHFTMPIVAMAIAGMQYYSQATLWPRMSQLVYATTDIQKGLYGEALSLGTIFGGIIIMFSKKIGHQRWQVFFSIALQTACIGAMSTASVENHAKSIILSVIISMCTSLVILNCLVMVGFGIVYQEDIGTAAGIAGTARLLAGSIAIAIFGNVSANKYKAELPSYITAAATKLNFPATNLKALIVAAGTGTAAAYAKVPGINPQVEAAAVLANKEAYLQGAHLAYYVALAFGLTGCIAALFIPTIDKRKYTKKTVALQEADRKHLEDTKNNLS